MPDSNVGSISLDERLRRIEDSFTSLGGDVKESIAAMREEIIERLDTMANDITDERTKRVILTTEVARVDARIERVEKIVFGAVGLILVAFACTIIGLAFHQYGAHPDLTTVVAPK